MGKYLFHLQRLFALIKLRHFCRFYDISCVDETGHFRLFLQNHFTLIKLDIFVSFIASVSIDKIGRFCRFYSISYVYETGHFRFIYCISLR